MLDITNENDWISSHAMKDINQTVDDVRSWMKSIIQRLWRISRLGFAIEHDATRSGLFLSIEHCKVRYVVCLILVFLFFWQLPDVTKFDMFTHYFDIFSLHF